MHVVLPSDENLLGTLWKLELTVYGLADLGRWWYHTSNDVLINRCGLTWSKLNYTLYYSYGKAQQLKFNLAVLVNEYMNTSTDAEMKLFEAFLGSTSNASKFARGMLELMGCKASRHPDGSIKLSQDHMQWVL